MARSTALFFLLFAVFKVHSLKLQEVFILGRHNVRNPLQGVVQKVTSREFSNLDSEKAALLTPRGGLLEQYMGEYFFEWLKKEGIFTNECPENESVLIYANVRQRTIETAKAFAKGAFKNCNVTVHYEKSKDDPVFHVVFKNTTTIFEEMYEKAVKENLDKMDLTDAYKELNRILDVKSSELCRTEAFCDFLKKNDVFKYKVGGEPELEGALSTANYVVDVFLMNYYDGKPLAQVAWGEIKNEEQWKKLAKVTREYQNIRLNYTSLARDIIKPMLNYIKNNFINGDSEQKFKMLVGHDSNQYTVTSALEFKGYELADQYELTPIGGKIVFQKWRDDNGEDFLKIEYIYQSFDQLRNATKLSLENPPRSTILEMNGCQINSDGFCPWNDFLYVFQKL